MEKRWRQGGWRRRRFCRRAAIPPTTRNSVFFYLFLMLVLLLAQTESATTFDIIISTPAPFVLPGTVVPTISPTQGAGGRGEGDSSSSPTLTYWNANDHLDDISPSDPAEDKDNEDNNSNNDEDEFSAKDIALAWAPKFSAFLSMCGSGYIIYDVIGTGQAFHSTHHRLLMGMSICTLVVSSLAFFMSTWPIPADSGVYMSLGNQATCDTQGFFAQFSLSVVMYNASLSAYYVAKVVYQCKTNYVHYRLEPFLHICPLTAGLGTALAGVFLDLYNNDGGWGCWIAAYPEDCNESWAHWQEQQQQHTIIGGDEESMTCIRGDNASIYRWVFYYGILWLAIPFVLINMSLVYKAVYAQEKKMNQYNFEYQRELERLERLKLEKIYLSMNSDGSGDDSDSEDSESVSEDGSVFSYVASMASASVASVSRGVRSVQSVTRSSVHVLGSITTLIPGMEKQHQSLKAHFAHSRRVSRQGYWFCGAFLATWMFPTVHRLVQLGWKMDLYSLHLLTAIFVPLQGFLNYIVFIQTRIKKKHIMNAFCCLIYLWKHRLKKNVGITMSTIRRNVGSSNLDLLSSDSSSDDEDESDKPPDDEIGMESDMSRTIGKRPSHQKDGLKVESPEEPIPRNNDGSFDVEAALNMPSEITDDEGEDKYDATGGIGKKYNKSKSRRSLRNSASFRSNSRSFRANSSSFVANSGSFGARDKSDGSFDIVQLTSEIPDDNGEDNNNNNNNNKYKATGRMSKKYKRKSRRSLRNSTSFGSNSTSHKSNSISFHANSTSFRANSGSFGARDKSDGSFDIVQMTSELSGGDDDNKPAEATERMISKKYKSRRSLRNSVSFGTTNSTSFRASTGTATLGGRNSISTTGGRSLISRSTSGDSSSFGSNYVSSVAALRSTRPPQHASLRRASLSASIGVQRRHMHDQSFQSSAASELTGANSNQPRNNGKDRKDRRASVERPVILEDITELKEEFHPFEISTANGFIGLDDDDDDLSSSEGDGTNTGAFNGSRSSAAFNGSTRSILSYLSGLGTGLEDEVYENSFEKRRPKPPPPKRENSISRFRFVKQISSRFVGKDSNEKPKPVLVEKDELAGSERVLVPAATTDAAANLKPVANVA